MTDLLNSQIEKVKMFQKIVDEELEDYKNKTQKLEEWRRVEPLDWYSRPSDPTKARVKRAMLTLREETIKLDKML